MRGPRCLLEQRRLQDGVHRGAINHGRRGCGHFPGECRRHHRSGSHCDRRRSSTRHNRGEAAPSGTVDPCAIVTTDDVAAAFGGTVAAGVLNPDNGGCDYVITGQTKTGDSGILTQASIELKSDYISFDKEKVVFPDIEKIDGVGNEAWYYALAHQLHINLGGQELLISGLFPGDEAAVKAEVVAFAKTVIGKL